MKTAIWAEQLILKTKPKYSLKKKKSLFQTQAKTTRIPRQKSTIQKSGNNNNPKKTAPSSLPRICKITAPDHSLSPPRPLSAAASWPVPRGRPRGSRCPCSSWRWRFPPPWPSAAGKRRDLGESLGRRSSPATPSCSLPGTDDEPKVFGSLGFGMENI